MGGCGIGHFLRGLKGRNFVVGGPRLGLYLVDDVLPSDGRDEVVGDVGGQAEFCVKPGVGNGGGRRNQRKALPGKVVGAKKLSGRWRLWWLRNS